MTLEALSDHETAEAREQDPQIPGRHGGNDLLLTHQQQKSVAVEPQGTHQHEKGRAKPAAEHVLGHMIILFSCSFSIFFMFLLFFF